MANQWRAWVMKLFLKVILPLILLLLIGIYLLSAVHHDDAFGSQDLLKASADQLQHTQMVADWEEPIEEGENLLWCGTFQLTWNEICTLLGEELHFRGNEPALVAALNKKSFTRNDIDEASFMALADYVKNGIYAKVPAELMRKFGFAANPQFLPRVINASMPMDIVGYAYLFKNLQFENPFEKLDEPLNFAGKEIPCFGISGKYKSGQGKLFGQVMILFYKDRDDFAVELKTKSASDRLILAKISPEATLEKTIAKTYERAQATKPQTAGIGDVLRVPKFNFDLTRNYHELEDLPLALTKTSGELQITAAVQNVRFQMDEKGVRLKSESHISIGCGREAPPQVRYLLSFDKPFLILLQRTDSKVPYFALWVDNAELLVNVTTACPVVSDAGTMEPEKAKKKTA
jgi:hypothetical protein